MKGEENYYKSVGVSNFFWVTTILSMKLTMIEIEHYELENILKVLKNLEYEKFN